VAKSGQAKKHVFCSVGAVEGTGTKLLLARWESCYH